MIEFLAVIFTLLSVWLTIKRHVMSWPVGLFAVAFYMLVFWQTKLYSDFGLQFIFFAQGIYGAINWFKNREDQVHTKVETLTHSERLFWLFSGSVVYVGVAALMDRYTDASVPWIDSFVAVFSLIANWILAKRKIESWVIWIGVDLIYINLFLFKELYWSAGLYAILLLLAIKGLKDWKKCLVA